MSNKLLEHKNPMQPMDIDEDEDKLTVRFKPNEIVVWLLQRAGQGIKTTMNDIAVEDFSDDDQMQFAQLIGYTGNRFCDLSYVDEHTADTVYSHWKSLMGLEN